MTLRRLALAAALLAALVPARAQDIRLVEDEDCGCDLIYVDSIETTRGSNGLYGFRHADGRRLTPEIFSQVDFFHDGYCKVMLDGGNTGLIDTAGRTVVPFIYDNLDYPADGRVLVLRDELWGFCDMAGREVIEPQFTMAGNFSEGCATVLVPVDSTEYRCTFIDTAGHMLFPPIYENLEAFNCGFALARRYQRWGIIDHQGRERLTFMYETITTLFGDTLFFAGDDSGMALFDASMRPLTRYVYTWGGAMADGRIAVQRGSHYGFLDRHGREVIPPVYDEVSTFAHGRAMVASGGRYGIIDTAGRTVLPMEYENKTPHGHKYVYNDGLALVEKNGRLGYVDLEGRLAVPLYFEAAYQFSEGLASVRHNGLWGYIDTAGAVFMPFVFDLASPYKWGRANVVYMGQSRRVDRKGRCVKNCNGIIAWRDWTE
ncbi:MAG: WG repeat-containing protein [Bacteroidales bacterium]|nr:WG repeat-containing protein [Bacteroidales bacterium]